MVIANGELLLRIFFAIDLSKEIKASLAKLVKEIKILPQGNEVRWVPDSNFHITLRFIGNLSQQKIPEILRYATAALENQASIQVELGELKLFPSHRKPRLVVLDILPNPALDLLVAKIEDNMVMAGIHPNTRRFKAHITLGRIKTKYPNFSKILISRNKPIAVSEVKLFQSSFETDRTVYTPLATISLCGP